MWLTIHIQSGKPHMSWEPTFCTSIGGVSVEVKITDYEYIKPKPWTWDSDVDFYGHEDAVWEINAIYDIVEEADEDLHKRLISTMEKWLSENKAREREITDEAIQYVRNIGKDDDLY